MALFKYKSYCIYILRLWPMLMMFWHIWFIRMNLILCSISSTHRPLLPMLSWIEIKHLWCRFLVTLLMSGSTNCVNTASHNGKVELVHSLLFIFGHSLTGYWPYVAISFTKHTIKHFCHELSLSFSGFTRTCLSKASSTSLKWIPGYDFPQGLT